MLLKQRIPAAGHIHQNNLENCKNLERVPDHLIVQIWIVAKDIHCINIYPLSLHLKNFIQLLHVFPFLDGIHLCGLLPEVLKKPKNRSINVLNADVGAPDEHLLGGIATAGIVLRRCRHVTVSGRRGGRSLPMGAGGGGGGL